MSSGTPMKAASSPSAMRRRGQPHHGGQARKRGIACRSAAGCARAHGEGWAPSGGDAAFIRAACRPQPLQGQQQAAGEQDQQRGDRGDGGRDVLADAGEHLPRQRDLLGAGQEQRHHDLVEGGREGERAPEITPGAITGSVTRKKV